MAESLHISSGTGGLPKLPYICMEKMLIISNGFSSEASGPVLLKFHAEPPWAGE